MTGPVWIFVAAWKGAKTWPINSLKSFYGSCFFSVFMAIIVGSYLLPFSIVYDKSGEFVQIVGVIIQLLVLALLLLNITVKTSFEWNNWALFMGFPTFVSLFFYFHAIVKNDFSLNTHYPLFFILAIVLGYAYRDLESRVDDEDLSITEEARRTQKNVTVLIYVCLSGILCFTFRLN